ncbi:hypothetical protein BURKHO8Y_110361 [Burkholderia sp. 8Y]|nr:hypothetical protein BURKHO8Y_110361 [Burkholderia sp. 8Y]
MLPATAQFRPLIGWPVPPLAVEPLAHCAVPSAVPSTTCVAAARVGVTVVEPVELAPLGALAPDGELAPLGELAPDGELAPVSVVVVEPAPFELVPPPPPPQLASKTNAAAEATAPIQCVYFPSMSQLRLSLKEFVAVCVQRAQRSAKACACMPCLRESSINKLRERHETGRNGSFARGAGLMRASFAVYGFCMRSNQPAACTGHRITP